MLPPSLQASCRDVWTWQLTGTQSGKVPPLHSFPCLGNRSRKADMSRRTAIAALHAWPCPSCGLARRVGEGACGCGTLLLRCRQARRVASGAAPGPSAAEGSHGCWAPLRCPVPLTQTRWKPHTPVVAVPHGGARIQLLLPDLLLIFSQVPLNSSGSLFPPSRDVGKQSLSAQSAPFSGWELPLEAEPGAAEVHLGSSCGI